MTRFTRITGPGALDLMGLEDSEVRSWEKWALQPRVAHLRLAARAFFPALMSSGVKVH
jgi:hypothetical protein